MRKKWGEAIRQQRLFKKMTQRQLAEKVGVEQVTVSSWEKGIRAPTIENQLAIARALDIDTRLLFAYPEAA